MEYTEVSRRDVNDLYDGDGKLIMKDHFADEEHGEEDE